MLLKMKTFLKVRNERKVARTRGELFGDKIIVENSSIFVWQRMRDVDNKIIEKKVTSENDDYSFSFKRLDPQLV